MKIICHNINDSQQWKIDRLLATEADVIVVPEIACPEQITLSEGYNMAWEGITWNFRGKQKWKGLGVIWKKGKGFVPDWYNPKLCYGIPLIYDDVLVLAFWPTKRKDISEKKLYPQIAQEIIAEYASHFKGKKVIITGDFNCYVNQRDYSKEYGDIRRIDEILENHGLYSIYHRQTGEPLGKETTPTYYHLFKETLPFFIDYTYTNLPVKSYRLLPWDSKMSDHIGQEIVF